LDQIIIEIINSFGYAGIAFLIAIENIFPPIPSEVILTFGGFATTFSSMNVWGVITAATAGSVSGAIVLYYLGRILNKGRLEHLITGRVGKTLRLKKGDVGRAGHWFLKHGNKTVFFCRFIPIVRSLISIPAGASKMKLGIFLTLTAAGTFIWNVVLVFLGRLAGDAWGTIAGYFDTYGIVAAVVFAVVAVIIGIVFIKKRFIKKTDIPDSANPSDEIS
jgi:membrane protein DedA with SNARE-associated domain